MDVLTSLLLELLLLTYLLANFFLNLLKGFQEELFNLASLVENNLGKRAHISELFVFDSKVFAGVDDVLALFLNNSFVLISNKLLLLLEVIHDLVETLSQNLDFALVCDVFLFHERFTCFVFLLGALVDVEVPFKIFMCV